MGNHSHSPRTPSGSWASDFLLHKELLKMVKARFMILVYVSFMQSLRAYLQTYLKVLLVKRLSSWGNRTVASVTCRKELPGLFEPHPRNRSFALTSPADVILQFPVLSQAMAKIYSPELYLSVCSTSIWGDSVTA